MWVGGVMRGGFAAGGEVAWPQTMAALPRADGSVFNVFFVGMTTAEGLRTATEAAFGPGLLGAVAQRERLPVDGRHLSKLRYDLIG